MKRWNQSKNRKGCQVCTLIGKINTVLALNTFELCHSQELRLSTVLGVYGGYEGVLDITDAGNRQHTHARSISKPQGHDTLSRLSQGQCTIQACLVPLV